MIDSRHVLLFLGIAILMAAAAIGIGNMQQDFSGGVASLGEYGGSDTYSNNVKLEEGSDIVIDPSDAHNSLIISVGETWIVVPAGSVQGDVLYHDGAAWARLTAGTVGYVLKTQGVGADPIWDEESDTSLPSSPDQGDIIYYSGSAWVVLPTGTSGSVLKTQGVGANPIWQVESDPTFPGSPDQGDVLYYNGSAWVSLPPGTSGEFLKTQGAAANPIWQSVVIANLDDITDVASITEARGQIIYYDGTSWNALNAGSVGQYLKTQGTGADPVWADVAGGGGARSATVTVAANGAVNASEYDYQCSGAADDAEINAALTAGAGGQVVLSEGGFQITANLTVPANTHFTGMGTGTVLTTTDAVGITNMVLLDGSNITVSDMKLVLGAGAGDTGTRPNVVYAVDRTNIWLESLWIVGDETVADDGTYIRQNGVLLRNVDDSRVSNCYSQDNKQSGIMLFNGSDYNLVTGNVTNSNTKDGISLNDASRSRVSDNNSFSNGQYGLQLFSTHYSSATGNVIIQNTSDGIYVYSCNYIAIGSNALYWNDAGITLMSTSHFANISNNVVHGHVTEGITLDSTDRSTIVGNFAYNAGHGLLLTNGSDNNTITGNHFSYAGNAGTHGIFVDSDSDNNIISSNTLFHNDMHGLYVFRSSRNSIVGNNCEGNEDGDGINITGDGTTNSDYNTVVGNVCYLNGSQGIKIIGGADANKNIVLGNQLISNVLGQLSDSGTLTEVAHNIQV